MNFVFKMILVFCFLLGLGFYSEQVFAQGQDKKRKRSTIDFEDELIQGKVKKPELLYLLQKKQFNFKRLIKLRENFIPEMRRTAEDIKSGSKD